MQRNDWQAARKLIAYMTEQGCPAYIVGGAVRDILLEKPVHDFDIVTAASPEEIMALFPRAIKASRHFDIFLVKWDDVFYEVSPFRGEASNIEADLYERDFTMNAIALDASGTMIDPLNGRSDLHAKRIKAYRPHTRFQEDPLRILRALRFVAELGFIIDTETKQAALTERDCLRRVPVERIRAEIGKLLVASKHGQALAVFFQWDIPSFLPAAIATEDQQRKMDKQLDMATLATEEARWAAFLLVIYVGAPVTRLRAWKFSNHQKNVIHNMLSLILAHKHAIPWDALLIYKVGEETAVETEKLHQWYYGETHPHQVTHIKSVYQKLPMKKREELMIDGRDILRLLPDIEKPCIGRLLNWAEQAVVTGTHANDKTELLTVLKEKYFHEK
ncbi:CCA tRNA nucleotidyltransferase [Bacillus piscicola]|uniref:CCA tRNA nucleotidyltransferase n=1 Tax=Bacillus piscicola TaxID=1632684 RepID=UPI001F08F017|nr:CCA tRNA nucleotidyltransferase [Bacillus piscicola]